MENEYTKSQNTQCIANEICMEFDAISENEGLARIVIAAFSIYPAELDGEGSGCFDSRYLSNLVLFKCTISMYKWKLCLLQRM